MRQTSHPPAQALAEGGRPSLCRFIEAQQRAVKFAEVTEHKSAERFAGTVWAGVLPPSVTPEGIG